MTTMHRHTLDMKRWKLLERAYEAEINAALRGHGLHIIQTRAALAKTMVDEGYFDECTVVVSGVTVNGYSLTHAGRMMYCMECDDS
ncbi:MAG TPA: hypothetical protein VF077_13445 [Nitrospiraceae bacterium]